MLAETWTWLLSPVSGSLSHEVDPAVIWHGRLMVLCWLIVLPCMILLVRFFKVLPGQDWPREFGRPFWFITHRLTGYLLAVIVAAAVLVIIVSRGTTLETAHAWLGWGTCALLAVQVVSALLRGTHGGPIDPLTGRKKPPEEWPGDHFSMTQRRIAFEYIHKTAGYLVIPFAMGAIYTGLIEADAPNWMFLGAGVLVAAFVLAFGYFQAAGRCVDTYQAIWGDDQSLPGNRRARPIGWGIRRSAPGATTCDKSSGKS